jgi:hypothetical protein
MGGFKVEVKKAMPGIGILLIDKANKLVLISKSRRIILCRSYSNITNKRWGWSVVVTNLLCEELRRSANLYYSATNRTKANTTFNSKTTAQSSLSLTTMNGEV